MLVHFSEEFLLTIRAPLFVRSFSYTPDADLKRNIPFAYSV